MSKPPATARYGIPPRPTSCPATTVEFRQSPAGAASHGTKAVGSVYSHYALPRPSRRRPARVGCNFGLSRWECERRDGPFVDHDETHRTLEAGSGAGVVV